MKNLIIVGLTQYLVRILLIGPRQEWRMIIQDYKLFLIVFSTMCIAAAGYIINDYFDIKIDIVNKPKRVVIGRYLKRRFAMGAHQVLNLLGVVCGLLVSVPVALLNIFSVTLLWFYSERYKRLPLVGNVAVSLLTALSLLILTLQFPHNRLLVVIYAVFSFFISLIREIVKDMEDVKGDAAHGCRTLPIIMGIRNTKVVLYSLISLFVVVLFLMAYWLHNQVLALSFAGLLLPVGWLVRLLTQADTRRDFSRISTVCKIIMLLGLLTMVWV